MWDVVNSVFHGCDGDVHIVDTGEQEGAKMMRNMINNEQKDAPQGAQTCLSDINVADQECR